MAEERRYGKVMFRRQRLFAWSGERPVCPQVSITITAGSTSSATYDALGRMVEKGVGSTYTQFVYNPDGTNLAVYSGGLTKGTISLPGGSSAIYNASGLNFIRHKDWLGSSRLATTWAHAVYAKEAYAPFGETYNELTTTKDPSFTGQDQNVVTGSLGNGVYDFLFRKYDPSAGRWLSPDPAGWGAVDATDPQSMNRYAYVENQPMTLVDPTGQYWCFYAVSSDSNPSVSPGLTCWSDGYGGGVINNPGAGNLLEDGTIYSQIGAADDGSPNYIATGSYWYMPQLDANYNGGPFMAPQSYYFSMGSGGGGNSPSMLSCGWQAAKANWVQVGLDAAGIIPFESTAVKGVQLAAGIISGGISAYQHNITGMGLSVSGMILTVLDAEKPFLIKNAAEAIPIAGTIVSIGAVGYDIVDSEAYKSCRSGG